MPVKLTPPKPPTGRCKVCRHPDVNEIDRHLLLGTMGTRKLEQLYGVDRSSLRRHKAVHIAYRAAEAVRAVTGTEVVPLEAEPGTLTVVQVEADSVRLLETLGELERATRGILEREQKAGNSIPALRAVSELRQLSELLAKLAGELSGSGLSRAEVQRIGREIVAVIDREVADPEVRERVRDGIRRIRI